VEYLSIVENTGFRKFFKIFGVQCTSTKIRREKGKLEAKSEKGEGIREKWEGRRERVGLRRLEL
jgi:hypothetical protein